MTSLLVSVFLYIHLTQTCLSYPHQFKRVSILPVENGITIKVDVSAKSLLQVDPEALRSAGMSYRKIEYARGLAEAIVERRLDLQGMREQIDDEVISTITALRGFGLWSAEIYLMFSLRRRDVFPAGDLALRSSLGILKDMEDKLTPTQARQLVAHWSPWRSVGSLFLWHYYRGAPN